MVFTMNLMIVHGILLCNSFLISLCMFIVWKALLISSATVIVRAGVAIWLNLFAGVLFNVCSVVTVECCVAITERRDMSLYEVPLSMSLFDFGMGTMLGNFQMCGIMLVLKSSFQHACEEKSPRRPMCFRSLMFSLPGPCELLFLLCFIAFWSCGECGVKSLYFMCCSVNGSVGRVCCAFVNCLVKQFAICLGVVVI